MSEYQIKNLLNYITMKRLSRPDEMAGAVSFLASEDASYVTGHVLEVSGGAMIGSYGLNELNVHLVVENESSQIIDVPDNTFKFLKCSAKSEQVLCDYISMIRDESLTTKRMIFNH